MRTFLLSVMMIFLLGSSLSAQIVLEPLVTGNVERVRTLVKSYWHFFGSSTVWFLGSHGGEYRNVCIPEIEVNFSYSRYSLTYAHGPSSTQWQYFNYKYNHGILEFDLAQTQSGATFPPSQMTAYNWTARLVDLECLAYNGEDVELFDLRDEYEDGVVTESEFNRRLDLIAEGIQFEDIDITEILRRDLFGPGSGGVTSGFLFITGEGTKVYDHELPRIEIHGTWPTLTPTPAPTPTSTPTAAPTEPALPGVALYLSKETFFPGDLFKLDVVFTKHDSEVYLDQPFVLMLDVFGEYFWYPAWGNEFQYILIDLDSGIVRMPIFEFLWPDVSGTANGLIFYGALLNPDLTEIFGDWDYAAFGWGA